MRCTTRGLRCTGARTAVAHRWDRVTASADPINESGDPVTTVAAPFTDSAFPVSSGAGALTDRQTAITRLRDGLCGVGSELDAHWIPAMVVLGRVTESRPRHTTIPSAMTMFGAAPTEGLSRVIEGLSAVTDGELPTRSMAEAFAEGRERRFPHRARETRTGRRLQRSGTWCRSLGQRCTRIGTP